MFERKVGSGLSIDQDSEEFHRSRYEMSSN